MANRTSNPQVARSNRARRAPSLSPQPTCFSATCENPQESCRILRASWVREKLAEKSPFFPEKSPLSPRLFFGVQLHDGNLCHPAIPKKPFTRRLPAIIVSATKNCPELTVIARLKKPAALTPSSLLRFHDLSGHCALLVGWNQSAFGIYPLTAELSIGRGAWGGSPC